MGHTGMKYSLVTRDLIADSTEAMAMAHQFDALVMAVSYTHLDVYKRQGLATCGKIPFASSFAMFAAGRAFEQVRNSIGYPHLNVKIGATHAGISVGEDGATHQCNEDIAIMRTIPGMTIICPADDVEARAAVKAAAEYVGPVYMRFGLSLIHILHRKRYFQTNISEAGSHPNDNRRNQPYYLQSLLLAGSMAP